MLSTTPQSAIINTKINEKSNKQEYKQPDRSKKDRSNQCKLDNIEITYNFNKILDKYLSELIFTKANIY